MELLTPTSHNHRRPPWVCVVGPSPRFLSGITYYTFSLVNALSSRCEVSSILMRRLLPAFLYPGRTRVGKVLTDIRLPPSVRVFDGVDWYWVPSLFRALLFLWGRRPTIVVFQWWSGTVLHSYLILAAIARVSGAQVIVEFHEVLDTGEVRHPWVSRYVGAVAPLLFHLATRYVVHSEFDKTLLNHAYGIPSIKMHVIPHPAYALAERSLPIRARPTTLVDECHLLYFGVIRPFKGVEVLLDALALVPPNEISHYRLTVVGETWEGWNLPARKIAGHPHRDRILFVNRYVTDTETHNLFRDADVVVLPYRRSSQSGPLHLAMGYGLPVVTTRVGGLVEAAGSYPGAVLVDPSDPVSLLAGIRSAYKMRARRFVPTANWTAAAQAYCSLFAEVSGEECPKPATTP